MMLNEKCVKNEKKIFYKNLIETVIKKFKRRRIHAYYADNI